MRGVPQTLGVALVAAGLVLSARPAAAADDTFVVQAGHVVTIDGDVMADGGSVYVSGGRIEDVKPGLVNPWGAEVVHFADGWLLPGMVEAHSQGGLERANEQASNTPYVSVLDGIDPLSPYFEGLLRDGVTTVFVVPGDSTLFGGIGLVVKPVGRTAEEMIVRRNAGLKVSLVPKRGTSRMAHVAELRRTLDAARGTEGREVVDDPDDPTRAPRQAALGDLLSGEIPAVLACAEPVDVRNALDVMERYGLAGFLTLGEAARRAFPEIARSGVPCVLPADMEPVETDAETGKEERRLLARECREAGIPVVIQAGESSSYGMSSLWYQAAVAVSQGLTRAEALRGVTLAPANVLGVADRVGSITKGKDANLVVWSGDPLDVRSFVQHVYIEGREVYDRAKDPRLARLLNGIDIGREDPHDADEPDEDGR